MKINEAIEILTRFNHRNWRSNLYDVRDAVKLGIEALKRYQSYQSYGEFHSGLLLPGETEEAEPSA